MAKFDLKIEALELRKKGFSYSQIKEKIVVSKSTLSKWLQDFPLSKSRIKELRDFSPRRIESYRNTMKLKRDVWMLEGYKKASKDLGKLSKREILIAGFFLYWGEGGKRADYEVSISNTDPAVIKFFILWLKTLECDISRLRGKLHLYENMSEAKEIKYWSKELNLPVKSFRKSYIKASNRKDNYEHKFYHGTFNVHLGGGDTFAYVMSGLKYIREIVHNDAVVNRL